MNIYIYTYQPYSELRKKLRDKNIPEDLLVQKFSKVSFLVILYSKFSSKRTSENLYHLAWFRKFFWVSQVLKRQLSTNSRKVIKLLSLLYKTTTQLFFLMMIYRDLLRSTGLF